jgi:hypothetical protein
MKPIPELAVVVLLHDLPEHGLVRGHTGTIVQELTDEVCLVEFSSRDGQAYAMPAVPYTSLLQLQDVPLAQAA